MKKVISMMVLLAMILNFIGLQELAAKADGMANLSLTIPVRPTSFPLTRLKIGNMMISAGERHTVGLHSDGTVVAVGEEIGYAGISEWKDIVAISANGNVGSGNTVGLKADGTVVVVGCNEFGKNEVSSWTNIVAVSAGENHTVGLKADGTVVAVGLDGGERGGHGQCDVSKWANIVAISAGGSNTVGLKADGTVVAVGDNSHEQCNVSSWTDIVAVATSYNQTVGLKSDGTVVIAGRSSEEASHDNVQREVSSWKNIVAVSIGRIGIVGLKADGTVAFAGDGENLRRVSNWRDIVAVSLKDMHIVGLKADGTVVATGHNYFGQCFTDEWQLNAEDHSASPLDNASDWARYAIKNVLFNGYLPDDLQNKYKSNITRSEFCRMAVKYLEFISGKNIDIILAEKGLTRNPKAFTDTNDPNILAALALGITNGTGTQTFTPNGQFSREQAATMIMNTCRAMDKDTNNPKPSSFADIGNASSWAIDGINFCFTYGIMNGTGNNNFSPKSAYTREQSIMTFHNIEPDLLPKPKNTGNALYDAFLTNKIDELSKEGGKTLKDFKVFDLDGDGVDDLWYMCQPEGRAEGLSEVYPVGFCTIIDGKVVELLTGGHYYDYYSKILTVYNKKTAEHVIELWEGKAGWSKYTYYSMRNGILTKIDELEWKYDYDSKKEIHTINGTIVTKEEFYNKYIEPTDDYYEIPDTKLDTGSVG